jgi:hypothetical protein
MTFRVDDFNVYEMKIERQRETLRNTVCTMMLG